MNILVIGNGFDLAHGLPTKYGDFLTFCEMTRRIYDYQDSVDCHAYEERGLNNWKMNQEIKDALKASYDSRKLKKIDNEDGTYSNSYTTNNKFLDELYGCINANIWLQYFGKRRSSMGRNWIDFELEISRAIQSLDELRRILINGESHKKMNKENKKILTVLAQVSSRSLEKDYGNIKDTENYTNLLSAELERLVRALEIYIVYFVGIIKPIEKKDYIDKINPDCVISFNYSDTYEKLYGNGKDIEYDYIHGQAGKNNTIESNNAVKSNDMVLGIDEYLKLKRMNKETDFIAFKKYYQRIYKGTGCKYKDWIYAITESAKSTRESRKEDYPVQIPFDIFEDSAKHNLYIFGHSLDITDKDIIRELILHDNVYTKIFYYNKADLGAKIANLVKVIGQDELIRRTGGKTKTIEFELQKDMT